MDTGASMDFIGTTNLSTLDKNNIITASDTQRCNTGNGAVTLNKKIKVTWAGNQKTNISIVETICDILQELEPPVGVHSYRDLIAFVADRPGHDRRYAVNSSKIKTELGWEPKTSFENGLKQTVRWYLSNTSWWNEIYRETYNLERLGNNTKNWLD